MANVVAKVEGLDKLQRMIQNAPKKARAVLSPMIKESAEAVAADAKRNVHRDAGDLANAIGVAGRGISWRAGVEDEYIPTRRMSAGGRGRGNRAHANPAVYGQWEERGTSRTGAHPFMRPAAEAEANRIPGRLRVVARLLETQAEE
jgi:HK97 gp10 family phage protein